MSPPPSDRDMSFDDDDGPISSLQLPPHPGSDDEGSDDDDPTLLRVHERIPTMSTASLDMAERIDALQRINDELRRKLSDTEDNLQKRLAEREAEIEDMQQHLDERRRRPGGGVVSRGGAELRTLGGCPGRGEVAQREGRE